jgi:membrane protease subunit HflK
MPWQSQGGNGGGSDGGGPWGSGSGGGSGGGGGGGGPWGGGSGGGGGGGPWGRGGGGGAGRPPDLEDFIRKGQERMRRLMPGGGGGKGIVLIGLILVALWLASGFYRVQPDQVGVELLFGKWDGEETQPGLNWRWPYPIGVVERPSVEKISSIDVGFVRLSQTGRSATRDVEEESLMLTGDQNIIDIEFTVQWKISNAGKYLFEIRDPESTVKLAAESAMREIIGQNDLQPSLTEARSDVEFQTKNLLQEVLNEYNSGIEITELKLQDVQPPAQVIDAFDDVQRAQQDRDRQRNEADSYRNDILPRARGEAQRVIQDANAYKERLENEADGEAQRFISVYKAYLQNPEVTRRRMYLETMQEVLSNTDKVILDEKTGGGVIPYLPLNELRRGSGSSGQQGGSQQ